LKVEIVLPTYRFNSGLHLNDEAERTLDLPRHEASRACPWLSIALVVGSVRREEEGTGIASDIVKVQGEDPGTPGSLRSVDTRKNPWTVRFPNIGSAKHSSTHTHPRGKVRVRPMDKLDEACTNADDQMMLVQHRSGDRVMR